MSTAASFSTPGRAGYFGIHADPLARSGDRRAVRASGVMSSRIRGGSVRTRPRQRRVLPNPEKLHIRVVDDDDDDVLLRADTEPTTRYIDGPLDAAAIWLFNLKLEQAVKDGDERGAQAQREGRSRGGIWIVALADRLERPDPSRAARGGPRDASRPLIPPWSGRSSSASSTRRWAWVDKTVNALITVNAFAWLVGPCEIVPRDDDGELAVKLRKQEPRAVRVHGVRQLCKRPTEGFFREAFGVDAISRPTTRTGAA